MTLPNADDPRGEQGDVKSPLAGSQHSEIKSIPSCSTSEWDRAINRQYLNAGGFCAYCGEACTPFTSTLPEELKDTACEYNGEHPQCSGEHKMEFEGKTPDTFGGYEIYVCVNPGCDYQEAC